MKRRLFKLALFLVLGTIVNVAVAWGCAVWSSVDSNAGWFEDSVALRMLQRIELKKQLFEQYPDVGAMVWNGFGYRLSRPGFGRGEPYQAYHVGPQYAVIESGWPLHCLEAYGSWNQEPMVTPGLRIYRKLDLGVNLLGQQPLLVQRTIPLRPIWPGFAINTIFYATILWLLTLGPFTARRMIRRKRGRCIKCGYDLRGAEHDVCPECGSKCNVTAD